MKKTEFKTELFVFEYLEDSELESNDIVGCGQDIPEHWLEM